MTTPTTLVDRARALLAGITPGEWRTHSPRTIAPGYVTSYTSIHAQGGYLPVASIPGLRFGEAASEDEPTIIARKTANAAFIAAAPALVRDLLATCEAQRARVSDLERVLRLITTDEEGRYAHWIENGICNYCNFFVGFDVHWHEPNDHAPDCPVSRARALLGE